MSKEIKAEIKNKLKVATDGYHTTITVTKYEINKGYRHKSITLDTPDVKDLISLLSLIK